MSVYPANGEAEEWRRTGTWFGAAGLVGLGCALAGHQILHGWLAPSLELSGKMFAAWLELVGLGLAGLMLLAALGCGALAWQQRGGVEVTEAGVCRVYSTGRRRFVARAEIAGYRGRIGGGIELFNLLDKRLIVIPCSIVGYRECAAELREMGIPGLAAKPNSVVVGWKPKGWKEHVQYWGFLINMFAMISPGELPVRVFGLAMTIAWVVWIAVDSRKGVRRRRWLDCMKAVVLYGVGFWVIRAVAHRLFHVHG